MNVRSLLPWGRSYDRASIIPTGSENYSPLFPLHRDLNQLFEDAIRTLSASTPFGGQSLTPSIEIEETDEAYQFKAELPGLSDKDFEIVVQDAMLILRGEKRTQTRDPSRSISERIYGRFERRLALDDVDEKRISAKFINGVLIVTAPKSAQVQTRATRIPINQSRTPN